MMDHESNLIFIVSSSMYEYNDAFCLMVRLVWFDDFDRIEWMSLLDHVSQRASKHKSNCSIHGASLEGFLLFYLGGMMGVGLG